MGFLTALIGSGAGEAAASSAGSIAAPAIESSVASGAADAGLASSASETLGAASQASQSVPEFDTEVKAADLKGLTQPLDMSSSEFFKKPLEQGFAQKVGTFGKDFGTLLAKNLLQTALSKIPGGKTIGQYASQSFDNPTVKKLFANSDDELAKRDNLIQTLLRQRLGSG